MYTISIHAVLILLVVLLHHVTFGTNDGIACF